MKLTENTKIFDGVDAQEFDMEYLIKHIDEPVRKQILDSQRIVEEIWKWYEETKQPLPEGHIPIVSLGGIQARLKEILEEK